MKILLLLTFTYLAITGELEAQQDTIAIKNFEPLPFTYVEYSPEFPGGQAAMDSFIYSELKWPDGASKNDTQGIVIVQFVIDKAGSMSRIGLMQKLGYGFDEEAIRIVMLMQEKYKWKPASHNGRSVPFTYNLPIKFTHP